MKTTLALVIATVAACGGGSTPGDDTPGDDGTTADAPPVTSMNKVVIDFEAANSVRQSPNLVDPLMGTVYGQLFKTSEVTLTGPIEGATEFGNVEVAGVDLITAQTAGMWTSGELPPDDYTFLGFFDVDGNGAADHSPDPGDPVTIPVTNQFEITAGQAAPTQMTVAFDFVLN